MKDIFLWVALLNFISAVGNAAVQNVLMACTNAVVASALFLIYKYGK